MNCSDETMLFKKIEDETITPAEILKDVYTSLRQKGYNPTEQLVGYLSSGDPTYITNYNDARNTIRRVKRYDILEELVSEYVKSKGL